MMPPKSYLDGCFTGAMFGQAIAYCITGLLASAVVALGLGVLMLLLDRRKGWG